MSLIGIILGAFLLFYLQDRLYCRLWDKDLSVSLEFSGKSAVEGEECELCERVENRKLLPIPALKVKFQVSRQLQFADEEGVSSVTDQYYRNDVLSIRPFMRHVRRLRFRCKKRGYYWINGLDVVAGTIFLSGELPRSLESGARLYVYPRAHRSPEFSRTLQRLNGEILSRRHLLEDPFEFRGIREYGPQDTMREINWKATARTGELKVNMKNYTAGKAVRIFVNLEDGAVMRREELLEESIRMAAGAAQNFLSQGIRTAVYTNGPDIVTGELVGMEAASAPWHMETVNRGLARIDLSDRAPSFVRSLEETVLGQKETSRALYTVFISSDAQEDFQELLEECARRGMDFCWICPVRDQDSVKIHNALEPYAQRIRIQEGETEWDGV
ncbi:MAG TPA: DUF58 domain-containing protein [Candidatus Eisenbergiella merdigallinarum]|uniref:DUF58 domain-containing protein n=1 Tax=Candidatus Eisenbergiella merdigallinarum TaxID=2838552 RepID=A0A9D2MQK6_9FIRM|nr:DUF58 domain-containing protein [Candidatus Eisenbergiella merdigallinarum]